MPHSKIREIATHLNTHSTKCSHSIQAWPKENRWRTRRPCGSSGTSPTATFPPRYLGYQGALGESRPSPGKGRRLEAERGEGDCLEEGGGGPRKARQSLDTTKFLYLLVNRQLVKAWDSGEYDSRTCSQFSLWCVLWIPWMAYASSMPCEVGACLLGEPPPPRWGSGTT